MVAANKENVPFRPSFQHRLGQKHRKTVVLAHVSITNHSPTNGRSQKIGGSFTSKWEEVLSKITRKTFHLRCPVAMGKQVILFWSKGEARHWATGPYQFVGSPKSGNPSSCEAGPFRVVDCKGKTLKLGPQGDNPPSEKLALDLHEKTSMRSSAGFYRLPLERWPNSTKS